MALTTITKGDQRQLHRVTQRCKTETQMRGKGICILGDYVPLIFHTAEQ